MFPLSLVSLWWRYTRIIAQTRSRSNARFFFLRILLCPRVFLRGLSWLDALCVRHHLSHAPWDMAITPLRHYVTNAYSVAERFRLMQQHYEYVQHIFPASFVERMLQRDPVVLATILGKDGGMYEFRWVRFQRFRREGEISITLVEVAENLPLAVLTFLFTRLPDGERVMWIGGMQGSTHASAKEKVVRATRNLHGLRPKHAVLECAYALANALGIRTLIATSKGNHPAPRAEFVADYDSFWDEVGGKRNEAGNFVLPDVLPKRTLDEVPSKKKKDWLKRHGYIEECVVQTARVVSEFIPLTTQTLAR